MVPQKIAGPVSRRNKKRVGGRALIVFSDSVAVAYKRLQVLYTFPLFPVGVRGLPAFLWPSVASAPPRGLGLWAGPFCPSPGDCRRGLLVIDAIFSANFEAK